LAISSEQPSECAAARHIILPACASLIACELLDSGANANYASASSPAKVLGNVHTKIFRVRSNFEWYDLRDDDEEAISRMCELLG
jgi:hypothetical protein